MKIHPEGPQRGDLAPDVAGALDAEPEAAAFFDGLAPFYRRGYLRWIDGTKRRPEVRAARIAEVVELLKAGEKERPAPSRSAGWNSLRSGLDLQPGSNPYPRPGTASVAGRSSDGSTT